MRALSASAPLLLGDELLEGERRWRRVSLRGESGRQRVGLHVDSWTHFLSVASVAAMVEPIEREMEGEMREQPPPAGTSSETKRLARACLSAASWLCATLSRYSHKGGAGQRSLLQALLHTRHPPRPDLVLAAATLLPSTTASSAPASATRPGP